MEVKEKSFGMQKYLWLFCVIFFIYQYGLRSSVPNVLNEELREYFAIGTADFGSLIGIFYLVYTCMQIPVGLLIDRIRPKIITAIALSCVSIGMISFVATNNYWIAMASQALLGFGCSFSFVLIMKVTNDYFHSNKVALISSIAISCGSLGPVIMGPSLAVLSKIFPWKFLVLAFGLFGFLIVIIFYFIINESKLPKSSTCKICKHTGNHIKEFFSISDSVKVITANKQFLWIGLFSMLILGPISAFSDMWGVSFIKNVYEVDTLSASNAVNMIYLGTIVGGPLIAYLAQKIKSYKKIMISCAILASIALTIIVFLKMPFILLCIVLFFFGILATAQFLAFPAALSLAPKKIGATLTGVVNTVTMLGPTLIIKMVGNIIDYSHGEAVTVYSAYDYKIGMIASIVSLIIAIFITFLIKNGYNNMNEEIW